MRAGWVVVVLCVAMVTSASAQDIPEFNVERHCKSVSAMTGGGAMMLKACYEQEQSTYDAVKAEWPSLDPKSRRHCIGQARILAPPSYMMLHACVQQEMSAKDASGTGFKLKR
jgi:hypothetical protein